jgi:hypothetical protein
LKGSNLTTFVSPKSMGTSSVLGSMLRKCRIPEIVSRGSFCSTSQQSTSLPTGFKVCLFVLVRNSRKKSTFTLRSVIFSSFSSIKLPRKGLMVISLADPRKGPQVMHLPRGPLGRGLFIDPTTEKKLV